MKFSDQYPKDRFYAADFKGKPWTLTFRAKDPVTLELLGEGSASEKTLPVWHFDETPRKLPAVVTNGVCARALFGDESDEWGGHKITLYPAPDASGLSDDGLCIRVKGSPELKNKLVFAARIGRTKKMFTLVPTGNAESAEAATDAQRPQDGDPGAEAAADAFTGPDAANGDSEETPGRSALFDMDDPERPATGPDKKKLSEAVAHVPTEWTKQYRKQFGGRSNSELTHGEIVAFTAAAVKEALE